jgi:hypothetical protein
MTTQLTIGSKKYDTNNMIFSESVKSSIPDSKPPISFQRINISTKNKDGSVGELVFSTEENLFSFGVSENINKDNGKINGYSMAISLYNRDGATSNQKMFVENLDNILVRCKEHLLENRENIGRYDLEMNDLKKMSTYYIKKDKGKVVEGATPSLYPKLIVSKKQDTIITEFFDASGTKLNALDLIGKYCHVTCAIKIESIFIGKDISIQIKLYECEVRLQNTGMVKLLARSVRPVSNPVVNDMSNSTSLPNIGDDDDEDAGSLVNSDDDDEFVDSTPSPVPVVVPDAPKKPKRIIKKVK